jgi:hypothetical protein
MKRLAVLAACLVVLGACDKKEDATKSAEGGADAASAKPASGLNAPGNDPKIVELAKKAIGCKWEGKDDAAFSAFASGCPEYKAWQDEKDAFKDDTKSEPTLVSFMEDSDEKVRYVGAKRMSDDLGWLTDAGLSARVLTITEKSKLPRELALLGSIVGKIQLKDPAFLPRIKALFAGTKDVNFRPGIMNYLLPSNAENEEVFNWTRAALKDTSDMNVARAALMANVRMKTDKPTRCEALVENIESTDADFAGTVVANMTVPQVRCEAQYDTVLKSIDARIKAKTHKASGLVGGLRNMCDPKGKATPAHVSKALGLAHQFAEDKTLDGSLRANAIDASVKCDPKGGKAYIGKFAGEKDQDIKDTVGRLQK